MSICAEAGGGGRGDKSDPRPPKSDPRPPQDDPRATQERPRPPKTDQDRPRAKIIEKTKEKDARPPLNPSPRARNGTAWRPRRYYFVVIYPKGAKCNFKTPKGAFRQPPDPSAARPSRYYFVVIYPKGTECNFKTPKGAFRQPPETASNLPDPRVRRPSRTTS